MFTFLLLVATATAEEPTPESTEDRQVIYKQRTEIDFEGIELEGELIKPQGALLLERRSAKFNPLIRLRTDFDVEMSESVKEIR